MADLKELEEDIRKIKERNTRVEAEKAWEASLTRRVLLAASTYFLAALLLIYVEAPNPLLAALVPTFAYLLSTMTLPFLKEWRLRLGLP